MTDYMKSLRVLQTVLLQDIFVSDFEINRKQTLHFYFKLDTMFHKRLSTIFLANLIKTINIRIYCTCM